MMLNYSLMMNPNSVLPNCDTLVILDSGMGLIFDSFPQRATSKDTDSLGKDTRDRQAGFVSTGPPLLRAGGQSRACAEAEVEVTLCPLHA